MSNKIWFLQLRTSGKCWKFLIEEIYKIPNKFVSELFFIHTQEDRVLKKSAVEWKEKFLRVKVSKVRKIWSGEVGRSFSEWKSLKNLRKFVNRKVFSAVEKIKFVSEKFGEISGGGREKIVSNWSWSLGKDLLKNSNLPPALNFSVELCFLDCGGTNWFFLATVNFYLFRNFLKTSTNISTSTITKLYNKLFTFSKLVNFKNLANLRFIFSPRNCGSWNLFLWEVCGSWNFWVSLQYFPTVKLWVNCWSRVSVFWKISKYLL